MKKILLLPLAMCFTYAEAQNITVRDNSSRDLLPNVVIKDKNGKTATTNNAGAVNIGELDKSDSLTLWNLSYHSKKFMAGDQDMNLTLSSKLIQLDEIIFSANKKEENALDVPYNITVIKQKEIEFSNPATSADMLQNTGQVFVQKSQLGGGSAVMRGFEANKVLIVVDGIRMNNAIYRGGHLQDLITLDPMMLDRTELVFGPSSTIYGSDALGGVMHFYTKKPMFSANDKLLVKGNGMVRYGTAMSEQTGHIDLNVGGKKFASMTNITFSDFNDLKSGTTKLAGSPNSWDCNYYVDQYTASNNKLRDTMLLNPDNNVMKRSGYSQFDLMQRFAIKTGEHVTHELNLQYSQSTNINRYDRLTETTTNTINVATNSVDANGNTLYIRTNRLRFGEWYYGPQKRLLGAYTLNFDKSTAISDNIKVIAAYQKIDQDRISRNFRSDFKTYQWEDVGVISFNVDAFKKIKEVHELRYGLEVTANNVKSTAETRDINADTVSAAKTRYGDNGNKMNTNGVYLSHSWEVNENFVISDGLRFTANSLESNFKDTTFYKFPYTKATQKNSALTGCLGFTWREKNNYKVSILANTGFRTPNIDDMAKVFESGAVLIVPNPDIKPEYATNFELSFSKIIEKNYRFDFTTYYTVLENALVLADYKFNGADSAMFNGTKRRTQAMQNKDRAYIYGVTGGMQFDFNQNVSFRSTVSYVYGRYADVKKDTVVPLDHIPPLFGQTSLLVKQNKMDGEFFVRFQGKKATGDYSPSGEDNALYSADKTKGYMPAWFTVNVRAGYNLTNNIRINVACENITDNRYRVFASGINAPGRNFIISLRAKF